LVSIRRARFRKRSTLYEVVIHRIKLRTCPAPRRLIMKKPILTFVYCAAGSQFLWEGSSNLVEGLNAESWPTAQGIIKSTVITEDRGLRGTHYTPVVKYDYEVSGNSYSCDRVSAGDPRTNSMSHAATTLALYPKGNTVSVHYKPNDPATALLEVGTTAEAWIETLFSLFIVGLFARRFLHWQSRHSKAPHC
jgi:hypothetical protein